MDPRPVASDGSLIIRLQNLRRDAPQCPDYAHDFVARSCDLGRGKRSTRDDRVIRSFYGLWDGWVLKVFKDERGAAPVEVTFAIVLLMILSLGIVQVAFALYARNVVASSAHEGARAALERGRDPSESEAIVRDVVARATGRLVEELSVDVSTRWVGDHRIVTVRVHGVVTDFGPIPFPVPLSSTATAQMDEARRR